MKKRSIIKIISTFCLLLFFLGSSPAQAQFPAAAVGKACVLKNPDGSFTQQPFSCTTPPGGAIGKTCYIVGVFIPGSTTEQVNFTCQYPTGTVFGTCTRPGIIPTQTAQWNCLSPGVWTADPRQTPACSPFYVFSTTQNKCVPQTSNYEFLAPLPDPFGTQGELLKNIDTAGGNALGRYLNIIIRLAIGFAAVLAMIMIVMGGIQYMTSELVSSKEDGKNRINNALLGLLVALGAWLILFTINPALLNTNVNIPDTIISYEGSPESSVPFSPATGVTLTGLQALGITCDSNLRLEVIAASFMGKSTYDQTKRNTVDANTAYFDCSSYVAQVYACKGLPSPGGTTLGMFGSSGTEQIQKNSNGALNITINQQRQASINGVQLKIGDLVGWTDPDGGGPQMGHVLMYIGGGGVIDSRARTATNQAVSISDLSYWANDQRLKFVKRLP